jgi:hypothetical protein
MKSILVVVALFQSLLTTGAAFAEPEYTKVEISIDIDISATDLWARVGGYCDIRDWANIGCDITSGDGEMGTVRTLTVPSGKIVEILIAKTDLAYGYTQPVQEGSFYNLYHGFMEARPIDENHSKLLYTVVYDLSDLPDQAAKTADIAGRRGMFEGALKNIKAVVEKR